MTAALPRRILDAMAGMRDEVSDSALVEEFLEAVPEPARATVEQMLAQAPMSIDGLRRNVREHLRAYLAAASEGDDLDVDLAEAIEARCQRLLDLVERDDRMDRRAIVQAACEYFVWEADADGDFDSVTGLDDDAEVLNAALFALGEDEDPIRIG